jgi:hypothetical protein
VGSKTFDGVWFAAFSHDHPPPHVHGRYGDVLVIVELTPDGIRKSGRRKAVVPSNAKNSDVRHILEVSAAQRAELMKLWEGTHGPASK